MGTLLGSAYRSSLDLSGLDLSDSARAQASESIGGAVRVAGKLPNGPALLAEAQSAFVDAFRITNYLSIAVTLAAGVLVFVSLRRRGDQDEVAPAEDLDLLLAEGSVDIELAPAGQAN
jgi:DHA2 family multidrug resistance protein-like MFS transporter